MLLSGAEIQRAVESGELLISPCDFSTDVLQPASIDLHLDPIVQVQSSAPIPGIKVIPEDVDIQSLLRRHSDEQDISNGRSLAFEPGRFVIGKTTETVGLPFGLAGRVEGRSRLARLGIGVHITAPKIDPGFRNQITLEIFNLGPWTVELSAGMRICTFLVEQLREPSLWGYQGRFQGP